MSLNDFEIDEQKEATYRRLVNPQLMDDLKDKILHELVQLRERVARALVQERRRHLFMEQYRRLSHSGKLRLQNQLRFELSLEENERDWR